MEPPVHGTAGSHAYAPTRIQVAMVREIPLAVFQYALEGHPTLTEYWNIVALKSRQEAIIFELAGNADTYTYITKENHNFSRITSLRGGVRVGSIPEDKIPWMQDILKQVFILRHNLHAFDCQVWVVNALRLLRDHDEAIILQGMTSIGALREELRQEMERWEAADETLEEREYPE